MHWKLIFHAAPKHAARRQIEPGVLCRQASEIVIIKGSRVAVEYSTQYSTLLSPCRFVRFRIIRSAVLGSVEYYTANRRRYELLPEQGIFSGLRTSFNFRNIQWQKKQKQIIARNKMKAYAVYIYLYMIAIYYNHVTYNHVSIINPQHLGFVLRKLHIIEG